MKEKAFVLCDAEVDYAQQMAEFLRKDQVFSKEIIVCSKKEELEILLQRYQVDRLLISETLAADKLPECPDEKIIILNESGCVRFPQVLNIQKYQAAEEVRKELLKICADDKQKNYPQMKEPSLCTCVAFYSPVRRCLQTTTAITYSQIAAEQKRVLYINMECCAVFSEDAAVPDLGALLCCADLELESFALRVKAAEKCNGSWSYIIPMQNGMNISEIPASEWRKMLDKCRMIKGYDLIVLDLNDSVQGAMEILAECERIYMLTVGDVISAKKIKRFDSVLSKKKMEQLRQKIIQLQVPFVEHLPICLEEYGRGKLAEWVRKVIITEEKHGLYGVETKTAGSCD